MSKSKMVLNFEGMQYVRDHYTDSKMTDTLFAAKMSEALGHPYTVAKVRAYRFSLHIPNNNETTQTVRQELETAKSLLARAVDCCVYTREFDLAHKIRDFLNPVQETEE